MKKINRIKILFLVSFVIIGLESCEKDDNNTFDPEVVLTNESLEVSNINSEQTVDVLTNSPWTVESNVDWITFTETNGKKGRFDLSFSVAENEDDARTGIITIQVGSDVTRQFTVVQEAGNRDDVFVSPEGAGEGYTWSEATNLDNALQIAVSGNTIHIAEGTYFANTTVTGGAPSDEGDQTFEINKNITLKGGYPTDASEDSSADPAKYSTVLSGNGSSYHVVTISAAEVEDQKVVLDGLTIRDGNASSEGTMTEINGVNFRRDYGGGVSIGNTVVDIKNSRIIDNNSEKNVAGLYAFDNSIVTIEDSKIFNNISRGNAGGIWISESKAYITDSKIIANEGGTAPGVHGYPDAEIYMNNSIIADNKGRSFGAAFYIRKNSKGVLVNCLISGNESTSTNGGGGVMMYNDNEVTLISTTITNNTIAGPGGGLFRRKGTNVVEIYNSIISGNKQKDDGPDVDVYESDASDPIIRSSIAGNMVYDDSGAEVADFIFSSDSMLKVFEENIVLPVGEDNLARKLGMSSEDLIELNTSLNLSIKEEIIIFDLLGYSRKDINIMGAFIKE